jgi:hypothetical protein
MACTLWFTGEVEALHCACPASDRQSKAVGVQKIICVSVSYVAHSDAAAQVPQPWCPNASLGLAHAPTSQAGMTQR